MKNGVIICGYPKSGSTWLTRLTAGILHCPVAGFWCEPFNNEVAIEGSNRTSDFQCFKAHHRFEDLKNTLNLYGNGTEKILYIYRDPRAVAVSASHYFIFPKYRTIFSFMTALPRGRSVYKKYFHQPSHCLDRLVKGMIHGTSAGSWLQEPWEKHVEGYIIQPDVLNLSYEMLRERPLLSARKISDFLAIEPSDAELQKITHEQSFEHMKQKYISEGNVSKARFLSKGEIQTWQHELPDHHIRYIEQNAGELMVKLGYSLA